MERVEGTGIGDMMEGYLRLPAFLLAGIVSLSCDRIFEEGTPEAGSRKLVEVRVDFSRGGIKAATRGIMVIDDESVRDCNVFVYDEDGFLVGSDYSEGSSPVVGLLEGKAYSFYALVNVGEVQAPLLEEDIADMRLDLPGTGTFPGSCVPMESTPESYIRICKGMEKVILKLDRLCSKIIFSVDSSGLGENDFRVNSVRIRQGALDVLPFRTGSAASVTGDCDSASGFDLETLNSGGETSFYVLENCQGILLPGNRDEWGKVPDGIGEKASLCTYLEVLGTISSEGYEASVSYKMYLGSDNVSDFNLRRGNIYRVTLVPTVGGLSRSSWKVGFSVDRDIRSAWFTDAYRDLYEDDGEVSIKINWYPGKFDCELADDYVEYYSSIEKRIDGDYLKLRGRMLPSNLPWGNYVGKLQSWDGVLQDMFALIIYPEKRMFSCDKPIYDVYEGSRTNVGFINRLSDVTLDYDNCNIGILNSYVATAYYDFNASGPYMSIYGVKAGKTEISIILQLPDGTSLLRSSYIRVLKKPSSLTGCPSGTVYLGRGETLPIYVKSYPEDVLNQPLQIECSGDGAVIEDERDVVAKTLKRAMVIYPTIYQGLAFTIRGDHPGTTKMKVKSQFENVYAEFDVVVR